MADNLTPEQRRKTMRAVKGRNTSLERLMAAALSDAGWLFQQNVASLPGKPDFVFEAAMLAVFIDGDFWHGWQYPRWKHKITDYWQQKIERNRRRDQKNFSRLRRRGWKVVRIWGHEVNRDLAGALARVRAILEIPVDPGGKDESWKRGVKSSAATPLKTFAALSPTR